MNDIRISGSGTVGSGEYNEVKISGSGRICGDVKCERFAVSGSAHSAGVIECSGELSVSGSLKTDGGVKADSARISGSTAIGGSLCKHIEDCGQRSRFWELHGDRGVYKRKHKGRRRAFG